MSYSEEIENRHAPKPSNSVIRLDGRNVLEYSNPDFYETSSMKVDTKESFYL